MSNEGVGADAMGLPASLTEIGGCACAFCQLGFPQMCLRGGGDALIERGSVEMSVSLSEERLKNIGAQLVFVVIKACAEQRVEDARAQEEARVIRGVEGFDQVFDDSSQVFDESLLEKGDEGVM